MKLPAEDRKRLYKADPLAGKRDAINNGNGSTLFFPIPSAEMPCPVEVGEVFPVRIGGIEVIRKERVREDGQLGWRVSFKRIRKAEPEMLLKRGGGLTTDPDLALRSQDDPSAAATIDAIAPEDRSEAHRAAGEPLEGAPVPHHVVKELSGSVEAQQRYERQMAERRIEEASAPIEDRLARLREMGRSHHVDLSSEERVITRRLEAMEQKLTARGS
jgi:hypothetical protein